MYKIIVICRETSLSNTSTHLASQHNRM